MKRPSPYLFLRECLILQLRHSLIYSNYNIKTYTLTMFFTLTLFLSLNNLTRIALNTPNFYPGKVFLILLSSYAIKRLFR